ncbi:protease II [Mycobacterium sp. URHB0021]
MPYHHDADSALAPPVARTADDGRDPYGWITEPTAELIELLDAERAYYEMRTAPLAGLRATLAAEMTARVPDTSESAPWRSGAFTYREVHAAGAEFPTLVRRTDGGRDEPLIDLQMVADAHPDAEFHRGEIEVSPDGRLLAWSYDVVGDERYGLRFRDLRTGADLPGVIEATFPSGGWSADATTYVYLRTDAVNRPHQVWSHTLGADPSTDVMVLEEPDERFEVSVHVTRSGAWFVITASSRNTSEVHLLSTAHPAGTPILVRPRQALVEYFVEHAPGPEGDRILIVTNSVTHSDPESFRIATAPVDAPADWSVWGWTDDVAEEDPAMRISKVDAFESAVVVSARRAGVGMLTVCPYGAAPYHVWPDQAGGLVTLGRNEVFDADFVTVVAQSFIHPTRHEDIEIASGRRSLRHVERIVGVDTDAYGRSVTLPRQRTVAGCPSSPCTDATSTSTARRHSICTATAPTKCAWIPISASTGGAHCRRCSTAGWCARSATPAAEASRVDDGGSTVVCARSPTLSTIRPPSPIFSPGG